MLVYALSLKVDKFNQTDRRNENRISTLRSLIQNKTCGLGKSWVIQEIPNSRMSINHNAWHQISARGKLPHISFRASSISSARLYPFQTKERITKGPISGM